MTYQKKLLISKILVSLGLCVFAIVPLSLSLAVNHMVLGHLIALPIMLWAIWGKKLHGTGRSVRLMAYLGLALTMDFYLTAASRARIGAELQGPGQEHMIMGIDGNLVLTSVVFILLLSGIFISIRRGTDAE